MGHLELAAVFLFLLVVVLVQGSSVNQFPTRFDGRSTYSANSGSIKAIEDELNYRLPNGTSPTHYDITITTNVHTGDLVFKGIVIITLRVDLELTKNIVVHARQLENFTSTLVDTVTGTSKKLNPTYDSVTEFLTLTPEDNSELVQGRFYTLTIAYDGHLRLDNRGFFLSTYKNSEGDTVYLAATHFESTNARHGFPCYDEPAKRAEFTITINHDPLYTAISNMPVDSAKSSSGKTVFTMTPKMPTNALAYVISDLRYTSASLNGLTQRIFSRSGKEDEHEFGLVSGLKTTARLADYLDVPFTFPKLDQVVVPDLVAGAMGNWGIATYCEEYMLYNPGKSTTNAQTDIASTIAHEDAHMWFGDLVTMKWWSHLWLKEGFATMLKYKTMNEVYPDWGIMQLFLVKEYQFALAYDGSATPRPMTHYVQKPSEIDSLYDTVSYSKAGAVLLMWQHAITEAIFRAGLTKYLRINEFSAAEEDDLFDAISSAAKDEGFVMPDTMKVMMGSWTNKGGVPILTVERNYEAGTVKITQNSFYNDPKLSDVSVWYVPVNYATSKYSDFRNTTAEYYLNNTRSIEIVDKDLAASDWLILNKQSTGYYRVQYDEKNWGLISEALIDNSHAIHPHNRAALMDDAYRLCAGAQLKHSILLNLMTYLQSEDQFAPWSTASSIFVEFDRFLNGDPDYDVFKGYVGDLVKNIYDRLGVNDESAEQHFQNNVRTIAINLACNAGIESCLSKTSDKLKALVNNGIEIDPNLQSAIYCNGLKQTDGDTEFNYVYNRLMASDDQAESRLLISSLGCVQNPKLVKKFIESSIIKPPEVTLRAEERTTLLTAAYSRGEVGLLASIEFLEENYVAYAELTSGLGDVNPLDMDIIGMSKFVINNNQADKLRALIQKVKGHPSLSATLETTVETNIQNNFQWLKLNRDPIMNWIIQYKSSASRVFASIVPAIVAVSYMLVRFF